MPLNEVAGKFGLKLATVEAVDESGLGRDGKPVALPVAPGELLKSVFAASQGDTGRVTDTQDGSIYAIRLDKVTAPQLRPLAEVTDKAIAAWQAEQKRQTANRRAEELAAKVTPELPLAKAAADLKYLLLTAVPVARGQAQGQKVSPALVPKLFAAKPGDTVTASDATGAYVAQLKEIQTPETVPDEAAAVLAQQVANEIRGDVAAEFAEALRRRYPVEIKRDALDRMF
jgi:peptidyl-prolyl cis-trans isomerase D